jgi:hypothetical protein
MRFYVPRCWCKPFFDFFSKRKRVGVLFLNFLKLICRQIGISKIVKHRPAAVRVSLFGLCPSGIGSRVSATGTATGTGTGKGTGSGFVVRNRIRFSVFGNRKSALGRRASVFGYRRSILGSRASATGTLFLFSSPISDIRFPNSETRYPISE